MTQDATETRSSEPGRRGFMQWIGAGLGLAAAAAVGVPVLGGLLSPLLGRAKRERWIDLGPLDQFAVGETQSATLDHPFERPWDGATRKLAVYVRRPDSHSVSVFSANCTHLGCPVAWFRQSGLFMCPCHGGVYYEDGSRASGPPPRGLYSYPTRVTRGRLAILGGHLPTLHDTFKRPA